MPRFAHSQDARQAREEISVTCRGELPSGCNILSILQVLSRATRYQIKGSTDCTSASEHIQSQDVSEVEEGPLPFPNI